MAIATNPTSRLAQCAPVATIALGNGLSTVITTTPSQQPNHNDSAVALSNRRALTQYTCLYACLYTCLHTCLCTCLCTCLYTCLRMCLYITTFLASTTAPLAPRHCVGAILESLHAAIVRQLTALPSNTPSPKSWCGCAVGCEASPFLTLRARSTGTMCIDCDACTSAQAL